MINTKTINIKNNFIRCYLNYNAINKLFSIGAFFNNPNEKKLKFFITKREKEKLIV